MLRVRKGKVIGILKTYLDRQELSVLVEEKTERAVAYPDLTGEVFINDEVWLNTTAIHLGLGTGGRHFVMGIIGREKRDLNGKGHIMKLRYTPWQISLLSAEEENAVTHRQIKSFRSLEGTPVVVGDLHSMLAPVVMAFHERMNQPPVKQSPQVVYIMTDGAALPIALSQLVKDLKARRLIKLTITCGHAFGGDLETVNVYSALVAAKAVGAADLIMVAMGPGIVGTGTKYGFTGIEQTYILEAVERLGGRPIIVPRISFADPRPRHLGLSHHTRTVLGLTYAQVLVGIPMWNRKKRDLLRDQVVRDGFMDRHCFYLTTVPTMGEIFELWGMEVRTMGRSYQEDPTFFQASGAAGFLGASLLKGELEEGGFSEWKL